jgi:hypothetical protein
MVTVGDFYGVLGRGLGGAIRERGWSTRGLETEFSRLFDEPLAHSGISLIARGKRRIHVHHCFGLCKILAISAGELMTRSYLRAAEEPRGEAGGMPEEEVTSHLLGGSADEIRRLVDQIRGKDGDHALLYLLEMVADSGAQRAIHRLTSQA